MMPKNIKYINGYLFHNSTKLTYAIFLYIIEYLYGVIEKTVFFSLN